MPKKLKKKESADMSMASWDSLTGVLRSDGWEDLDKDDEKVWGQQLVGMQIYAMGHGSGEVKSWAQNRSQSGDGKYVVELADGAGQRRTETLTLWRKSRGEPMGKKTPFLFRRKVEPQYRRRRDNLTHRDAWSSGSADLEQELTAAQANCLWADFDLESRPSLGIPAVSVDAAQEAIGGEGKLQSVKPMTANPMMLKRHQTAPESASSAASTSSDSGGGSASSGIKSKSSSRDFRRVAIAGVPAVVVSSQHQCKLTRRAWKMKPPSKSREKDPKAHLYGKKRGGAYRQPAPGHGLACRLCKKVCRCHGENSSWNCRDCKFDLCNPCLEGSGGAEGGPWALIQGEGVQAQVEERPINLTANYGVRKSGRRKKKVGPELSMGIKHNVQDDTVIAHHQTYGHMAGRVSDHTLTMAASSNEPEPEPEPDSDDSDEEEGIPPGGVRCEVRIFPSYDGRSWVLEGEFHIPFDEPVPFTATAIGPVDSSSEEDEEDEEEEEEEEEQDHDEDEDSDSDSDSGSDSDSDSEEEEESEESSEADSDEDSEEEEDGPVMGSDGMPPRVRVRVSGSETDSSVRLAGRRGLPSSVSSIPDTREGGSRTLAGGRMSSTDAAVRGARRSGGGASLTSARGMTSTDEAVRGGGRKKTNKKTQQQEEEDDY